MAQDPGPHLIIGTAGHIDHGKTTLVRALTGVDTDRLPEEKRRGITIALGFAPLDLPSGRVGLVDVPGHERFVRTMVAGASGIDLALLVVSAEEGVMPQTREHLEILGLLGVRQGLVALTKIDRVPELLELAQEDLREGLLGSVLEGAPIVPVSALTGAGLGELRDTLERLVQNTPRRGTQGTAFFPIDRVFTVKGFGTVVTGTLEQGRIQVGEGLELLPRRDGHSPDRPLKVRGLQVFGRDQPQAAAGQRVAINLAGVDKDQVAVGQVLVAPGSLVPTRRLTVRFQHLRSHPRPLPTGSKGLFCFGTEQVEGGLTLLEDDSLEPGASGLATLRLSAPVVSLAGGRFITRGFESKSNAGRTIGGGVVLDAEPPRRRRRREETSRTLAALSAWSETQDNLHEAVRVLVEEQGPRGSNNEGLARRLGQPVNVIQKAAQKASLVAAGEWWVAPAALAVLEPLVVAAVEREHEHSPFRATLPKAELASRLAKKAAPPVVDAAARRLVERKVLVAEAEGLRRPQHRPRLELDVEKKNVVLGALRGGGLEPPTGRELEAATQLSLKVLIELLTALAKTGEVIHCGLGLHFEASVFAAAEAKLLAEIQAKGPITTADAKALFGISRKYLIPLLEAFDKRGVTARQGEARTARRR
ncbi:MAG: selenocysteine-specific translation elongation factor [Deltaproteobacteria bacterium]|nr:selenocysteine-specific translation elongation factor [Deltaproteobacteria bacterium]